MWSGRQATVAGLSAAALHGTRWIDPRLPAELYRRNGKPVKGILIHRDELFDDESQLVRGVPATTCAARGSQMAFVLGYADVRAFNRWTGTTPQEFRGGKRATRAPKKTR